MQCGNLGHLINQTTNNQIMKSFFVFLPPILSPSPSSLPSHKNQVSSKYPIVFSPRNGVLDHCSCEGPGSLASAPLCFCSEHLRNLYGFGVDPEGRLKLTLEMR